MAVQTIVIKVTGDARQLEPTLKELERLGKIDKENAAQFQKSSAQLQQGAKANTSALGGIKSAALSVGAALGGAFAIQQVVQRATQVIAEFEKNMAELQSITGATGDDLDFLKNKAVELSTTSTLAAKDIVEAFKLVGSAKPELLGNAEALASVTERAITLSEASGLDLQTSISSLGDTLNAFNLDATESDRIINSLAAASQKGTREVPFLAEAFTKFGGVAASANVSIEESAAAVEVLGTKIPEATTAGINLRNILLILQTQAAEQGREFEGLGAELDRLGPKLGDITFLEKTFGKENILAAQTLIEQRDKLSDLTDAITGTNTAYEQAAINTDTLTARYERFQNAIDNVFIRQANANEEFQEGGKVLLDLGTTILNNIDPVLSAALEPLNAFIDLFKQLRATTQPIIDIFNELTGGVESNITVFDLWTGLVKLLNAPLTLVVKGITLLLEGVQFLAEGVRDFIPEIREFIDQNSILKTIVDTVTGSIRFLIGGIADLSTGLAELIGLAETEEERLKRSIAERQKRIAALNAEKAAIEQETKALEENNNAAQKTTLTVEEQIKRIKEQIKAARELKAFLDQLADGYELVGEKSEQSTDEILANWQQIEEVQEQISDDFTAQQLRAIKAFEESSERRLEILKNEYEKGLLSEQEYQQQRHAIQAEATAFEREVAFNTITQIMDFRNAMAQRELDSELSNLEDQRDQALITEEQYRQKKRELLIEDLERQKKAAIFEAIIGVLAEVAKAGAITPQAIAIAVAGALQVAALKSEPIPEFRKGVEYLEGPGTGTSDSIMARLSKGERVVTAEKNKKYFEELSAIHNDRWDKYVFENYQLPIIKEYQQKENGISKSFAENIANAIEMAHVSDPNMIFLSKLYKQNKRHHREVLNVLRKRRDLRSL